MTWIPPVLVYVRVGALPLPLPIVLLWPFLLFLAGLAMLLAAALPAGDMDRGERIMAVVRVWRVLGALRGLRLDLQEPGERPLRIICL